ncbi:MAG: hypothetical protein GY777_21275 [Candidatus Brocadiaceae bacterium]|nr:hypothetical protein [Candidatus Brocadiaceae bacterium]
MNGNSQLIVFAGPSIEKEFIQSKLPHARVLPPVAQGQIAEIISHEDVQTILLIDGLFYHSLSVLHKEIILALQQGVNVVGCSSMGALRAAELHRYGMVGVGKVFEYYRDNFITGDDEVAVLHEPVEPYKNSTIPMINLRIFLEESLSQPGFYVTDEEAELFLDTLLDIPFSRRTYKELEHGLQKKLSKARTQQIINFMQKNVPDYKKLDAVEAVEYIASGNLPDINTEEIANIPPGYSLDAYMSSELHYSGDLSGVTPRQLWVTEVFSNENFQIQSAHSIYRDTAIKYAESQGLVDTERNRAIVTKSLFSLYGCKDTDTLRKILGLHKRAFDEFIKEEALLYALRYAHAHQNFMDGNVKAYCDSLRADGSFASTSLRVAEKRGSLSDKNISSETGGIEETYSIIQKYFPHLPCKITKNFVINLGTIHLQCFGRAMKEFLSFMSVKKKNHDS